MKLETHQKCLSFLKTENPSMQGNMRKENDSKSDNNKVVLSEDYRTLLAGFMALENLAKNLSE